MVLKINQNVKNEIIDSVKVFNKILKNDLIIEEIHKIANALQEVSLKGGNIFFAGNGGSAADSQHLAAELVGKFNFNRKAIKAQALTTDTSILTAIGNDYTFEDIFTRQIEALGNEVMHYFLCLLVEIQEILSILLKKVKRKKY